MPTRHPPSRIVFPLWIIAIFGYSSNEQSTKAVIAHCKAGEIHQVELLLKADCTLATANLGRGLNLTNCIFELYQQGKVSDLNKVMRICKDASIDTPFACNLIHFSIIQERYDALELLLRFHRGKVEDLTTAGEMMDAGYTALHLALNKPRALALILKAGGNPHRLLPDGVTPLQKATEIGNSEVISLIFRAVNAESNHK